VTAFAIQFGARQVDIASETLAYTLIGDPLGYVNKVFLIPHLRVALFGRGVTAILVQCWAQLMAMPDLVAFEQLAERMPPLLRAAAEEFAKGQRLGDHRKRIISEVVAAGWSAKAKKMQLLQFRNTQQDFSCEQIGPPPLSLTLPHIPEVYRTRDAQARSADAQLIEQVLNAGRYFADTPRGGRIGGEIWATTIKQDKIEQRCLYRFADYEQTRTAAAAVRARWDRGGMNNAEVTRQGLVALEDAIDGDVRKAS
jgi:hypothetical protein